MQLIVFAVFMKSDPGKYFIFLFGKLGKLFWSHFFLLPAVLGIYVEGMKDTDIVLTMTLAAYSLYTTWSLSHNVAASLGPDISPV